MKRSLYLENNVVPAELKTREKNWSQQGEAKRMQDGKTFITQRYFGSTAMKNQ